MHTRLRNNLIHFKGSAKGELLYINNFYSELHIGSIILDIAALTPEFDSSIEDVIAFLNSLASESIPILNLKHLSKHIFCVKASPVLQNILLWQPLGRSETADRIEQSKYAFASPEQNQVFEEKYPIEILKNQVNFLRNCSALKWDAFCEVIRGELSEYTRDQLDTLMECFIAYHKEFTKTVLDIKRLRFHLLHFLGGTAAEKSDAQKTILEIGNQIGVATEGTNDYFKKHSDPKYSQAYFAEDLYSLVRLELNLLHETDRSFQKCQLCGKYFVPYSSKNVYCKNPNPRYGNTPCNKAGPNASYRGNRLNNPLTKEFDKNRKSYNKWCEENKKKHPDVPAIAIDIEKTFISWEETAIQAIESYERKELSYEEVWTIIRKPDRHNRSEKLTKLKKFGTHEWP